ncbi:MAG TPA: ABC transporter permease [Bacteroidales bacterium]|nr:ABC transporter permease [Bacteroidales bacterium]
MLYDIIRYALRNLIKNRVISVFNIAGLTLAISSILFLFLYLENELSFDRFEKDYRTIYNVYFDEYVEGVRDRYVQAPVALGNSLLEDYPEVEAMTRTQYMPKSIIKNDQGIEFMDNVISADSSFLRMFNVDLITGDISKMLTAPNQVCISTMCAKKYFSDRNPVGKTLVINDKKYEVQGVFSNYPSNSHLTFDLIGSLVTFTKDYDAHYWDGYMYSTYIKLHKNVHSAEFEKKLPSLIMNRLGPFAAEHFNLDLKEWFGRGNRIDLKLIPISKIHLYANNIAGFENQNSISDVIVIFVAVFLILFIACFNFVNFNICLFRNSCKTTGIKKICGSGKFPIIFQSFIEAFIIFILSSMLAYFVFFTLHPVIFDFFKPSILSANSITGTIPHVVILAVLISFICGCLPLIKTMKRTPSFLIKSNLRYSKKMMTVSQLLFSLQFLIATIIFIFFLVIVNQVNLITTRHLGFDKENVVIIHLNNRDRSKATILADEIRKLQNIKAVSVSNTYPGGGLPTKYLQLKDSSGITSYSPQYFCCDIEMMKVLQFKIIKGEFFSKNSPQNSILLNETALKTFGIKENPIGKIFTHSSDTDFYTVIGTIKDFNFRSLHRPVEPLCIYTGIDHSNSMDASTILIKFARREKQLINDIKLKWNSVYPDCYFDYSFLDDEITALYEKEMLIKKIIPIFMVIAFIISIIGLIGITFINLSEKIKEIGIRKVNGAKVIHILIILNKDFIKWIVLAIIVACPVAWYSMHLWLQTFAYKTPLSWWIFLVSGAVAMIVSLLTVSLQSLKVATKNPVEALRYE